MFLNPFADSFFVFSFVGVSSEWEENSLRFRRNFLHWLLLSQPFPVYQQNGMRCRGIKALIFTSGRHWGRMGVIHSGILVEQLSYPTSISEQTKIPPKRPS